MLRQYDNLKRGFALLGVILALSSGFQHAHWICILGGCSVAKAEDLNSADTHSCCHSHRCDADKATKLAGCDQSQDSSCPCPPECWCHQAPQPLELPRSALEPSELLLQGFVCGIASTFSVANYDSIDSPISAWATESMAETSVEFCAHFCRFLI
ncbi:hypothetical protein Pla144_41950 [Bythopirellula polymerisocia]|uniref:Uncharacterized protein n=1 Tax=Bythopirellula polymerisocia TaxID=2528003 RepID=A0A5C6CGP5_9BACT|nr:hypothetical protein Pla144_41950 [Bythopirellula polymerisocia]